MLTRGQVDQNALATFVYSEGFAAYDFGAGHALRPKRLEMTYELLLAYGAFDLLESQLVEAQAATDQDILLAHDSEYIGVVRELSQGKHVPHPCDYGFNAVDNPPFLGMYEGSLLYVGASLQAAELVASDKTRIAFNISGGLHHAMRDRASGFCVFNDPVVAIRQLLETFERVVYIDIDAHHGDGVQEAFYTSNRVMTVSIHESGRYLFPGTGLVSEPGEGDGRGYNVNLPLAPKSGDSALLKVMREGALPVVRAFDPQVIVAQLGADGHFRDPLTHLNYTTSGWTEAIREILGLEKPVVALGGGGYDPSAVCRMWALAYGEMLRQELPDQIPEDFANEYSIKVLRDKHKPQLSASEDRNVAEHAAKTLEEMKGLVFPYWPGIA